MLVDYPSLQLIGRSETVNKITEIGKLSFDSGF